MSVNKTPMPYRSFFILCLVVLTSLNFCGCDFIYGILHKQGAEEKKLIGDVLPLEPNPTVEEIQTLLKIYGYNSGSVDGKLGLRTRDAIARFQKEQGLEVSRFADADTWVKLKVFKDNDLIVDGELNVVLIQELLTKAGYDPGAADGKFGAKTKRAVLALQETHGLKVDGKIGYQTLSKLAEFLPL